MKCCNIPAPILPTAYTEELSYGEALGKVITKVNECVDEVNANDKKVDDLTNLVGTFDNRIAENTQNIAANGESINSLDSRIGSLEAEIPQFESSITTQLAETNSQVAANTNVINTLTHTTIPAIETNVNANTAAIAKSKEKMTLLSDITISQDTAGMIELISNTKISNFYIEISINKASNNAAGQLILNYTDESDMLYLTSQYAKNNAVNNTTFNVIPINGIHLYICGKHDSSPTKVLGNSQVAIHINDTLVNRIRFRMLENVSTPAGSTFKIYGILED